MANWFTIALSGVAAAMAICAAVMFLLYAKEFFYHAIPDEWFVISGTLVVLGLTLVGKTFLNGTPAELIVNILLVLESFAMATGFYMAYRSSEGGLL